MPCVETPAMPLRAAILAKVREGQTKPTELIENLAGDYPAPEIKQMVLRLLQDGVLELSSDMKLTAVDEAA